MPPRAIASLALEVVAPDRRPAPLRADAVHQPRIVRPQFFLRLFVGRREDVLRRDPETGWKIAKRLILLDQNVLLAKNISIFF